MSGVGSIARALLGARGGREGGVLVWLAVTAIPLLLAVGLGIDVARAYAVKVRLGAAVDDAALSVASTLNPNINATTRLNKYFYGNFASNQIGTPTSVTMVNDPIISNAIDVTGTATVPTTFMRLAGYTSITVQSQTQVMRGSPNIDFYLMLDSSPSMGIAATQADINTMVTNTSAQGGCAFGCHQSNTTSSCASADVAGNPTTGGGWGWGGWNPGTPIDNYALARSLGVTLRIDLVRQAAQNLTTTASNTATQNKASYRMAVYTFDVNFNTIQTLTSNLSSVNTSAGNIQQLEVYCNNWLTSTNQNNDEDTDFNNAMKQLNNTMPNPGNGSSIPGDTPQEVVFIVTDGVEDICNVPTLNPVSGGGCRQQYWMSADNVTGQSYNWCTAIKNRGIRIAILYTEYLPLPTNGWYVNFDGGGAGISSFQASIGSKLQACASPGLYFMVLTGGDISGALSTLFEQAVASAYLAK